MGRRERPFISIGRGVIIQEDCQIQALRIGDQVGIGKGCVLVSNEFSLWSVEWGMCNQG